MRNYFRDEAELVALVRAFEKCTIHPGDFKHYQHLAVALWYVAHFSFEEASNKMRSGIQKLAAAHGKMGYHETITMFWLQTVRRSFVEGTADESIVNLANALAVNFVDKNLIKEYYSEDLLASAKAKAEWVEPDLKQLDFTSAT